MRQRDSSWYLHAPERLILVLESAANSAFGAVKDYVAHLVSYLCWVFFGGGSMLLILLVNCVVGFLLGEGVYLAHLAVVFACLSSFCVLCPMFPVFLDYPFISLTFIHLADLSRLVENNNDGQIDKCNLYVDDLFVLQKEMFRR
jgi:hypothetical protein